MKISYLLSLIYEVAEQKAIEYDRNWTDMRFVFYAMLDVCTTHTRESLAEFFWNGDKCNSPVDEKIFYDLSRDGVLKAGQKFLTTEIDGEASSGTDSNAVLDEFERLKDCVYKDCFDVEFCKAQIEAEFKVKEVNTYCVEYANRVIWLAQEYCKATGTEVISAELLWKCILGITEHSQVSGALVDPEERHKEIEHELKLLKNILKKLSGNEESELSEKSSSEYYCDEEDEYWVDEDICFEDEEPVDVFLDVPYFWDSNHREKLGALSRFQPACAFLIEKAFCKMTDRDYAEYASNKPFCFFWIDNCKYMVQQIVDAYYNGVCHIDAMDYNDEELCAVFCGANRKYFSTPGYITSKQKEEKYLKLLINNLDKAGTKVQKLVHEVLTTGKLTDVCTGEVIDFSKCQFFISVGEKQDEELVAEDVIYHTFSTEELLQEYSKEGAYAVAFVENFSDCFTQTNVAMFNKPGANMKMEQAAYSLKELGIIREAPGVCAVALSEEKSCVQSFWDIGEHYRNFELNLESAQFEKNEIVQKVLSECPKKKILYFAPKSCKNYFTRFSADTKPVPNENIVYSYDFSEAIKLLEKSDIDIVLVSIGYRLYSSVKNIESLADVKSMSMKLIKYINDTGLKIPVYLDRESFTLGRRNGDEKETKHFSFGEWMALYKFGVAGVISETAMFISPDEWFRYIDVYKKLVKDYYVEFTPKLVYKNRGIRRKNYFDKNWEISDVRLIKHSC